MSEYDFLFGEKLMQANVDDAQRWVKSRDRLRQAGLLRENRLSRRLDRIAYRLGDRLVSLGERLRRTGLPHPPTLDPPLSEHKAR